MSFRFIIWRFWIEICEFYVDRLAGRGPWTRFMLALGEWDEMFWQSVTQRPELRDKIGHTESVSKSLYKN